VFPYPLTPAPGWHAPLIGAPYRDGGSDPAGWDCFGLICWCLERHFGVTGLDCHSGLRAPLAGLERAARIPMQAAAFEAGRPGWRRIERPVPGAGVLITVAGRPLHAGLALGGGRLLHVDRAIATCVERLDDPQIWRRIEGYYVPA
jgi:hypothetical protein